MQRNAHRKTEGGFDDKNLSSQKALKSKYILQGSKGAGNKLNQKVMLTDLCAEEKAKIGDLIKTLQQRKMQNQELKSQIESLKTEFSSLEKAKGQLENSMFEKTLELQRISTELREEQKLSIEKDIEMQELRTKIQSLSKVSPQSTATTSTSTLFETVDSGIQTREKRSKLKNRGTQVCLSREGRVTAISCNNSTSFSKIMKGDRVSDGISFQTLQSNRIRAPNNDYQGRESTGSFLNNDQLYSTFRNFASERNENLGSRDRAIERSKKQSAQKSPDSSSGGFAAEQQPLHIEDTENDDEEFDLLAEKWLDLKRKAKSSRGQGTSKQSERQVVGTHCFLDSQQPQQSAGDDEIDEQELNRALKSQDFSASYLLKNSRSRVQGRDSSASKTDPPEYQQTIHSRVFHLRKQEMNLQDIRARKRNKMQQQSEFHSPELLELAAEINQ